jgi:dTMP kinase
MTNIEQLELILWKEIAGQYLSVSHDRWHVDRVLKFAKQLQKIYGGDEEVMTAAVLLHDLGRSDASLHGQESILRSKELAGRILSAGNLTAEQVELIQTAIEEHDQPKITPTTIEGKILKDADFLAGFGAWGILRIALWSGESKRNILELSDRLQNKMPARMNSLEFPESTRFATTNLPFTKLFLEELNQKPQLSSQKGRYIVLEGISGSGKDTQIELLVEKFKQNNVPTLKVREPCDNYRKYRDIWMKEHNGNELDNLEIMKHFLMADRHQLVEETIKPALEQGNTIISARSYISTLVYQCKDAHDRAMTAYMHRFVPLPDLVILLDLDPDIAIKRVLQRKKKRGQFEKPDLLNKHRNLYLQICQQYFHHQFRIIDASLPINEISDKVWTHVVSQNRTQKI